MRTITCIQDLCVLRTDPLCTAYRLRTRPPPSKYCVPKKAGSPSCIPLFVLIVPQDDNIVMKLYVEVDILYNKQFTCFSSVAS